MSNGQSEVWVCVWPCADYAACQEHALVLAAVDVEHRVDRDERGYGLWVRLPHAGKARAELVAYAAEMRGWPPPEVEVPAVSGDLPHALPYWLVLVLVDAMARHRALQLDWFDAGTADAGPLAGGAWWRALTALTLHADGPHLINNLAFGTLFGLLLCHELGPGLGWLTVLVSGALGNWANALMQPADHVSLGASTGVFGAVGLLVALQWRRYGRLDWRRLRRWAPLVVGMVLLGYLGTGGDTGPDRTDVLAHVMGTVAGLLLGGLLGLLPQRRAPVAWQVGLGAAAALLLTAAWWLALR